MAENNTEQARFNMVEQQIRPWEVLDQAVLSTLSTVPREAFVPDAYRNLAFADTEIPLGHGEQMMKPVIEGRLLQALAIKPDDKVFEIGTGSGFITACLAELGDQVISVEIQPELAKQASAKLAAQGINNAAVKTGDALATASTYGHFDAIAVTGSLPQAEAADTLKSQLNVGGRLFAIIGEGVVMEACLITRTGENQWIRETLFETELPPLTNASTANAFQF
ncbi:MAG: protein-L-isoaspartate O-methyltransferase [Candidatus Polarisedimenticolaceae bacterium]|nr:protein-L-isoaspartate O-methyltransferase [Candidatus Polarisedimenticolaceae bacterium]